MAIVFHPKTKTTISDLSEINDILKKYSVSILKWEASAKLYNDSTQEEILAAYSHELKPFMTKKGFKDADVINVHKDTPNLLAIREKFMKEHTHSEDEIRFFVDGEGKFWFHFDDGEIFCVTCSRGDFISVPKNYKHWFDLHPNYFVKAIRIFSNMEGWTPIYTNSDIDKKYNP
jgi:1,2-dihydroxy-3-keto-5-methylthiopentene dioxygenase